MNKQVKRQSKILDECLRDTWAGRSTVVDECLRQFPKDASRLAPMLTLAVEARDCLAPNEPNPSFIAASRKRILSSVSRRPQQSTMRRARTKRAWRWQPAQALIGLMLAIGILAISTGVVQAANAALPGDALYGLKRGLERARLAVTWSAGGDMRLLAQFADVRLAELEALLAANRLGDMDLALNGYEEALSDLTGLAGEAGPGLDPGSLENILERLDHHQEVLARVSEQVPASVQAAIERAMEHSSHSQDVIEQVRQGGGPSDLAPGQQRTPSGQQRTPPGQQRTPPGQQRTPSGQGGKPTPTRTATPTQAPPTATPTEEPTMHVQDLDIKITGDEAMVTIHVARDGDAKVDGATVTGTWTASGPGVEYSCDTTASGKCTISSGIILSAEQTTFMVTSITHPSFIYAPGHNSDPDGDSNGTFITIRISK